MLCGAAENHTGSISLVRTGDLFVTRVRTGDALVLAGGLNFYYYWEE